MKKILCLTDFSENASNGILYADELAKKFSSTLIFMHTYEPHKEWLEEDMYHPSGITYTDTDSRNKLYKLCMSFIKENKYSPVTYEFIVKEGSLSNNLNKTIKENNIDLVVFSVEGELQPPDTYYGNLTSEIVQTTACPVLAIPTGYKYNPIQKIVYAFDIEKENTIEKKVIDFTRLFEARLNILSYSEEEGENQVERLYSKFSLLKAKANYDKIDFDLKKANDIITSLNQFIVDRNADLLIIENHKRKLYERLTQRSFSKQFVFFAKKPVLIIRSEEK
jgi:nucleotide-binding universal stress UspA family protein